MRTIKFRAWDNVDYMSSPFTISDIQNKKIEFTDEAVIMQFTGLLDKNGKEIYEGDILWNGDWLEDAHAYNSWQSVVKWDTTGNQCAMFVGIDGEVTKVIGNIYENSNILN